MSEPLLSVKGLTKSFPIRGGLLQRQLGSRDGVAGANRFGPAPPA